MRFSVQISVNIQSNYWRNCLWSPNLTLSLRGPTMVTIASNAGSVSATVRTRAITAVIHCRPFAAYALQVLQTLNNCHRDASGDLHLDRSRSKQKFPATCTSRIPRTQSILPDLPSRLSGQIEDSLPAEGYLHMLRCGDPDVRKGNRPAL